MKGPGLKSSFTSSWGGYIPSVGPSFLLGKGNVGLLQEFQSQALSGRKGWRPEAIGRGGDCGGLAQAPPEARTCSRLQQHHSTTTGM